MVVTEWVIWGAISVFLLVVGYLLNRKVFQRKTKKKTK